VLRYSVPLPLEDDVQDAGNVGQGEKRDRGTEGGRIGAVFHDDDDDGDDDDDDDDDDNRAADGHICVAAEELQVHADGGPGRKGERDQMK
jgi:hypothetical protein